MKTVQLTIGLLFFVGASAAMAAESPWYFRADVGYALGTDADIKDNTPGPGSSFDNLCDGSGAAGSCNYQLDDVGNSSAWSVGVGYRLDDNIRMDVTLVRHASSRNFWHAGAPTTAASGITTSAHWAALLMYRSSPTSHL